MQAEDFSEIPLKLPAKPEDTRTKLGTGVAVENGRKSGGGDSAKSVGAEKTASSY
jgi:hypothetical protein